MPQGATEFPMYQPAMRIITAITQAPEALVTTSFNHQYLTGTIVRLYIPLGFGMTQADKQEGTITVTSTNTFTITLDTTNFDPFVVPLNNQQFAQVVPVGEVNDMLTAATQNVLPY